MRLARIAFIISSIPFTLLCLVSVLPFGGHHGDLGFILCGGVYVCGSIYALRDEMPLAALVLSGIILNLVGFFIWIPGAGKNFALSLSVIKTVLAALWFKAIYEAYRESRH